VTRERCALLPDRQSTCENGCASACVRSARLLRGLKANLHAACPHSPSLRCPPHQPSHVPYPVAYGRTVLQLYSVL